MKKLLAILLLVSATTVSAQEWENYKDKTYLGGYYFAVCKACLQGSYNDDNNGYWACTASKDDATIQPIYQKGCAKGIWDAFFNKK